MAKSSSPKSVKQLKKMLEGLQHSDLCTSGKNIMKLGNTADEIFEELCSNGKGKRLAKEALGFLYEFVFSEEDLFEIYKEVALDTVKKSKRDRLERIFDEEYTERTEDGDLINISIPKNALRSSMEGMLRDNQGIDMYNLNSYDLSNAEASVLFNRLVENFGGSNGLYKEIKKAYKARNNGRRY